MNYTNCSIAAAVILAAAVPAHATLATWQAEVGAGTAPAVTLFSTVSGATPQSINVGSLSGDRAFEFIYNAGTGVPSQALLGSQDAASGSQGLKVDQWNASGVYGVTDFGVADHYSSASTLTNQDVHIIYSSDGVDTHMYLNGALAFTYIGVDLTVTGLAGIGAADNSTHTAFFDQLQGSIFGFASYDSALSAAEVGAHYNAFVIPEPGVAGLAMLAGFTWLARRRSR